MHVAPAALIDRQFDVFLGNLEGALDGDVESVHQARVATRRLLEILPLVDGDHQHVVAAVRSAGRHLGGVRELDVLSSLLDSLGSRIPSTAAVELHQVTQAVRIRRADARRKMVKALERLDLPSIRNVVTQTVPSRGSHGWWRLLSLRGSKGWTTHVWERVVARSSDAAERVRRTRAIYFPNRAHRARVAIKKLRYALEVVADAGLWRADTALRDLRRLQGALGNVHDLQVLRDAVVEVMPSAELSASERSPIAAIVEDDLARWYADYVKRRDRVFTIADVCRRAAHRQGRWRIPPPVVAAVFTAPVIVESLYSQPQRTGVIRRSAIHPS